MQSTNLRAGEGFIAGLCTLFMNPARVYQLVDQLRQDFEAGAACKRDTCKALGFPAFPTTNQKAGSSNLSGRTTYPRSRQLQ